MSLKNSSTTADYMAWEEMINLLYKLTRDGNYKMSLLIAVGCFWGLRISDILNLRWSDILDKDVFTLVEKKTKKKRTIKVNLQLKQHIQICYQHIHPQRIDESILISQKGLVFSVQRINVILKELKVKYRINIKNFSCHSLRKTFGRRIFEQSGDNSEMALVKLMELFNHSSIMITKRYLGLRQEELLQAYDLLSF